MKKVFRYSLLAVIIVLSSLPLSTTASANSTSLNIKKGESYTFTLSGDHYGYIYNEGDLIITGNGTLNGEIRNCGGNLTIAGKNISIWNTNGIANSDGGTVTVEGSYIYGANRAFTNEEGCTLNLFEGASFSCEAFMYSALTNHGTVNGDNFRANGYQGAIDNSGTLNLKNGSISTQYSYPLGTSGNAYIENCTISAGSYGGAGGISGSGTLTIKDSKISLGISHYTVGIGFRGNLTVDNCNISASNGITLTEGTATITNSSISGIDYQYGCAVSNFVSCTMTIDNCNLRGNEGLGNGGIATVNNSTIESTNNWLGTEKAISNSGTLYCNNSTVKSSFTAYEGSNGTAEFKDCIIEGFDFSWDYDPMDLYGNESTFYMSGGTVKLYDTTLPKGFYVLTDKESEAQYAAKDLIAPDYALFTKDGTPVALKDTDTMLDGEYYTAQELPDFTATIDHLNEYNITSADKDTVEAVLAEIEKYNSDNISEENAEKIEAAREKCNTLLDVIEAVKQTIDSLINTAEKSDSTTSDTDAAADAEKTTAQADSLLAGNNLTQLEREAVESAKAKLKKFVDELKQRENTINDILIKATESFTTEDEDSIKEIISVIDALLKEKLTENQLNALHEAEEKLKSRLEDFADASSELERIKAEFDSINRKRVNIFDKTQLEQIYGEVTNLISRNTLGGTDLIRAEALQSDVNSLLNLIHLPEFYGIIRIFWTFVSIIKAIIL